MKIMESSRSSSLICLVRRLSVAASPEEFVRQRLLTKMIGPLGYPRGHLSVEKNLFFAGMNRRIDIVCFHSTREGLKPLLLIECKAGHINIETENQLFGYNAHIGAPFLCFAGGSELKLFWQEQGGLKSISFLPTYKELSNSIV